MQPLGKTSGSPFIRKPHSIRLVEIPATNEGHRSIKLSLETAGNLPANPEPYGCRGLRISESVVFDIHNVDGYKRLCVRIEATQFLFFSESSEADA
uniref:Uncharacterized protein n=1 Tax=Timema cristinae TaxID=61476 RepID=A0A7R9H559_TIMCR|nr:unnamed protein product [Timema cristinae]